MTSSRRPWPRVGGSIFRDLLRRADKAASLDELRALRRFAHRRLEGDERLAELDEAIERRAMAMIAESEGAAGDAAPGA